ncbi:MAG: fructose-bisphosphate aldolase [Armatimonadetes bacterium]|nr:fructose-bisphosphate aldolase [Armatimonadota bacterium]NIM23869.1 fructose-bisphosphate aldolase [Armatimonadota bacterium]NIM67748.1 fructose-bisphosphate aldolase [Armatimonadota bacterium]NIM76257.1 fructose-bisphosphate aldolase [Armatimonadota bacterium]NIN05950.1 fructose-bisphosphate aldolase [Armatimonadota bacterium]
MATRLVTPPTLDDMDLSLGKRTRLYRLLFQYGPANGTLLLLPIDQGLEHGPRDFFANPESADPDFQLRLALKGNYSGIVMHVGLARKYMHIYAGRVPLVLKLNGKTDIPSDAEAFSPQTASVEEAVRLGADAVGYTLYVGSPAQDQDFIQLAEIREECERLGMPLIVWSYPRGEAIERKGGRDGLYAIDYAARVAAELGADLMKLNLPQVDNPKAADQPKPYDSLSLSAEEGIRKVIASAGRVMVIISGGSKMGDEDLLDKARICMEGGATGLIFGRNLWQRPWKEAMALTDKIEAVLAQYGRPRPFE